MSIAARCYAAATTLLATTLVPAAVRANDRDIRAITVPPSSCSLRSGNAFYGSNFWGADGGEALLQCPLPINNIDLSGTTNDNDISKFRTFYRDSDGSGSTVNIVVTLGYTKITVDGLWSITGVCTFSSSPATIDYTNTTKSCVHDVASGVFYFFQVRLNAVGGNADFVGIDFPP